MARSVLRNLVSTAALLLVVVAGASPAPAADVGVAGQSLVASKTRAGKEQLKSTQKGTGVGFGSSSAASELSGTFEVYYVDTPSNRATLGLPSPWSLNTGLTALYRNPQAPAGPTAVRSARIQAGKNAGLVSKGLGGLDLASPPGPGGVATIFTVQNADDGSTHRLCTLYRTASGSSIAHKVLASGSKLVLKRGVATACPTCSDGVKNDRETGLDCGGDACPACPVGQGCNQASDCQSGACVGGVCQATCNDGLRDGSESDVDCGGASCPACGTSHACQSGQDCASHVCQANVCQAPSCSDGVKNGGETDVDCGGSCPACVPFSVVIDTPAHGSFSTASSAAVTGHTTGVGPAGADLTINGNAVPLGPGGAFSTSVPLAPSLVFNPVYAHLSRHFDGLEAFDRKVVIAGASIAEGSASPNGVAMRIADRGLDAVEPYASTLVNIDPATLVTPGTPVLQDYCYASLGSLCLGSVDVSISGTPPPAIGGVAISTDSQVGAIAGDIRIDDLRVTVNIDAASGIPLHCELHLTVPTTHLLGSYDLSPMASEPTKVDVKQVGSVSVQVSGTSDTTDCTGLLGSLEESLIASAIGDVGTLFANGMQGFLNTVDAQGNTPIAGAIETALDGIDIAGPVGAGLGIDLHAPFTSIAEDDAGVTFAANIAATTLSPDPLSPHLTASYHVPEAFPTFTATTPEQHLPYGIALGISTSGFNQLLRSETESGLLRSTLTSIDFLGGPTPITAGLLGLAFAPFNAFPPDMPVAIRIKPTLAPVVTGANGPAGELGELRMGQIVVEFVQNLGTPAETVLLALAVDARIGLDLAFQPGGIGFALSQPAADDITVALLSNPLAVSESALQAFLPTVLAGSLPDLASALASFPLPQFIGLNLSGVEVSREGQYYSIFADLTPACTSGTQCPSGVCLGGVCQSPSCTDGRPNGGETDVDCGGGSCPGCATGKNCFLDTDCAVGGCSGGICQPACTSGAQCPSGVCSGGFCRVPNCADGARNGQETGVDCGGPSPYCARCAAGAGCSAASDCASGVCSGGVCQAPSCSDGVKNGSELDVDCGGGSCPGCALGKACGTGTDCASGVCGANARCTCGNRQFTFTVNSNTGGLFSSAQWPGGTATQTASTGCSVTINRPDNNIDLVCTLASPFSVRSFSGFSQCFGAGGEDGDGCQPVSCPPAGIGSCCSGRPSCSAALNGSGSARYLVTCLE